MTGSACSGICSRRAWLSLLLSVVLLFIAFVRFGDPNRQNIIFDAPYFIIGGIIYLYRNRLAEVGGKYKWLCAVGAVVVTILFFATKSMVNSKMFSYLLELCMFTVWLTYAAGSCDCVLNNRVVYYLSGISMEIYLCHMLFFRVVERMHIERFIDNVNVLYIATFMLTICGAIAFAHIVKYYVLAYIRKRIKSQ